MDNKLWADGLAISIYVKKIMKMLRSFGLKYKIGSELSNGRISFFI